MPPHDPVSELTSGSLSALLDEAIASHAKLTKADSRTQVDHFCGEIADCDIESYDRTLRSLARLWLTSVNLLLHAIRLAEILEDDGRVKQLEQLYAELSRQRVASGRL